MVFAARTQRVFEAKINLAMAKSGAVGVEESALAWVNAVRWADQNYVHL